MQADTRTCVCVGPAWKALPGRRQEMHQLRPIITLCGLTEAYVLIMSGYGALFSPRFFFFFYYSLTPLCKYVHVVSCAQQCRPRIVYGGEHGGWHGTTEPSTPIYASCGDLATDVYEVQKCAKLSASNILQPAALPRTLLTLKVWPQFGGRLKTHTRHSAPPLLFALLLLWSTFTTLKSFTILISLKSMWILVKIEPFMLCHPVPAILL